MNGPWFTKSDAALAANYGFYFLLFYQKLWWMSQHPTMKSFKVAPKFHYLCRLLEYTREHAGTQGSNIATRMNR